MYLLFDTETTGIPNRRSWRYPDYTDALSYNNSRLVSIAFIVLDERKETIHEAYYVIKPNGFDIPLESTMIHGFSTEEATRQGIEFNELYEILCSIWKKYNIRTLVAHNISFDYHILLSELYRHSLQECKMIKNIIKSKKVCTLDLGFRVFGKYMKLSELYKQLFSLNSEPLNLHNALADAQYCAKCFVYMTKFNNITH